MKQMRASAFKARCLKIMNEIQATGEPVIVTKRGKPVVKILPADPEKGSIFGFMAGKFSFAPLRRTKAYAKSQRHENIRNLTLFRLGIGFISQTRPQSVSKA